MGFHMDYVTSMYFTARSVNLIFLRHGKISGRLTEIT